MSEDRRLLNPSYSGSSSSFNFVSRSGDSLLVEHKFGDAIPLSDQVMIEWNDLNFFVPSKKPKEMLEE